MAIVKNPKRNLTATLPTDKEQAAEAFITGAGQSKPSVAAPVEPEVVDKNKKPIMVRIDPEILARVDKAARRLGISRSAFLVSSAVERLERME